MHLEIIVDALFEAGNNMGGSSRADNEPVRDGIVGGDSYMDFGGLYNA